VKKFDKPFDSPAAAAYTYTSFAGETGGAGTGDRDGAANRSNKN